MIEDNARRIGRRLLWMQVALAMPWLSLALVGCFLLSIFNWWGFIVLMVPLGVLWLVSVLAFILVAPRPTPIQRATGRR